MSDTNCNEPKENPSGPKGKPLPETPPPQDILTIDPPLAPSLFVRDILIDLDTNAD